MSKRGPVTAIGLAMAFGLFAFTFRGRRERFWERMTLTGFLLGDRSQHVVWHEGAPGEGGS